MSATMTSRDPRVDAVLTFWLGAPGAPLADQQARWFRADPELDAQLRARFGHLVAAGARGELDGWRATAPGALALVILLDQFSRNIYRGSARAFAQDARALAVARAAIAAGHDRQVDLAVRPFFYLPFEHAEDRAVQRESVELFRRLRDDGVLAGAPTEVTGWLDAALDYAHRHAAIIERFGRYPHRNAVVGRASTPAELEFLKQPGSSF